MRYLFDLLFVWWFLRVDDFFKLKFNPLKRAYSDKENTMAEKASKQIKSGADNKPKASIAVLTKPAVKRTIFGAKQ